MKAAGDRRDVVALLPAAGHATRLGTLGQSKEAIRVRRLGSPHSGPVCQDFLEACGEAGVPSALLITRRQKIDLALTVSRLGLSRPRVVTVIVPSTPSPVHTLAAVADFVGQRRVVLGFPDILLAPTDCLDRLLSFQEQTGADLALGLFPAVEPERTDTVELDSHGIVRRIAVKERESHYSRMWMFAVWTGAVSRELATYAHSSRPASAELHVGHFFSELIREGVVARGLDFPDGRALDVGTPEALRSRLPDEPPKT